MLGDVGGLFDALKGICSVVITICFFIFGDPLDSYLLRAIFLKNPGTIENKTIIPKSSNEFKLNYLRLRTPLRLPRIFCECMRSRKDKKIKGKGLRKIEKEFEIDQFLKQ